MITVYYTNVYNQNAEILQKLLQKVNAATQKKILTYQSREGQLTRLCGKLLLNKLLTDYKLERIFTFDNPKYNEFGKPSFSEDIDFNIAHSGNLVICAGALTGKIGVDTEKKEDRDVDDMKEYFTYKEWDKIITNEDVNSEFYKLWVRKEACLKGIGRGLLLPLNEIDVCEDEVVVDDSKWYLHDLYLKESYATCIAANVQDVIQITEVDINELVSQQ